MSDVPQGVIHVLREEDVFARDSVRAVWELIELRMVGGCTEEQ